MWASCPGPSLPLSIRVCLRCRLCLLSHVLRVCQDRRHRLRGRAASLAASAPSACVRNAYSPSIRLSPYRNTSFRFRQRMYVFYFIPPNFYASFFKCATFLTLSYIIRLGRGREFLFSRMGTIFLSGGNIFPLGRKSLSFGMCSGCVRDGLVLDGQVKRTRFEGQKESFSEC